MISSIEQSMISEQPRGGAFVGLTLPMPLKEYPSALVPPHLMSHPELEALQELWMTARGDQALPRRSDFDLGAAKRWAPQLSIATVTLGGRFQFRLFDLTGCILDNLAGSRYSLP
jgi:hypothetical protein